MTTRTATGGHVGFEPARRGTGGYRYLRQLDGRRTSPTRAFDTRHGRARTIGASATLAIRGLQR